MINNERLPVENVSCVETTSETSAHCPNTLFVNVVTRVERSFIRKEKIIVTKEKNGNRQRLGEAGSTHRHRHSTVRSRMNSKMRVLLEYESESYLPSVYARLTAELLRRPLPGVAKVFDRFLLSSSLRRVSFSIICLYCLSRMGDGSVRKSVRFRTLIFARFGYFNASRPSTLTHLKKEKERDLNVKMISSQIK